MESKDFAIHHVYIMDEGTVPDFWYMDDLTMRNYELHNIYECDEYQLAVF